MVFDGQYVTVYRSIFVKEGRPKQVINVDIIPNDERDIEVEAVESTN